MALVRRPARLRLDKRTGYFYADFYDPDRVPTRKWVALHVRNRRAAEKQLARLNAAFLDGTIDPWSVAVDTPAPGGVPLQQAVTRFLADRRDEAGDARPLAPRSIAARTRSLNAFAASLPPEATPADVTPDDVRRFVHRPELSEWSRRTYHGHVSAFLAWCVRQGHATSNAAAIVLRPQVARRPVAYLTTDDLSSLLKTIHDEAERVEAERAAQGGRRGARPGTVRWFADVVRFTVYTGMRLGEVCALRWSDVRGGFVNVVSSEHHRTKSGHGRAIPLVPPALAILDARRATAAHGPDDPVFRNTFGGPLSEASTSSLFRKYREKAGLPDSLTFHTLRKTCGVVLASAGVDIRTIQAILGHADVRITGQIYTDVLRSSLATEMSRAFTSWPDL